MLKIASAQYAIKKFSDFSHYSKKIKDLVARAKQQNTQLILLPEYSGTEIAGACDSDAALYQKIQVLLPEYLSLMTQLATKHEIYIQAGTLPVASENGLYKNRAYFFSPSGVAAYQDKLHLTEFEKNSKLIIAGNQQTLFETRFGKVGVTICYDSEFPEVSRNLVLAGAELILVPSYTIDMAGYHRVYQSSRARAIENQCYVAVSFAVGEFSLTSPTENLQGAAAILSPIDDGFPEDGVLAQGQINQASLVFASLDFKKLQHVRDNGQVHNFKDFNNTRNSKPTLQIISL